MPESLVLCADARLSAAIQQMCANVGISTKVCTGPQQVTGMLAHGKHYGIIMDGADPEIAAEILRAIRCSPSNRRAVSVVVLNGAMASLGATFELRTPVTAELALRTFRAAQAAMLNEFRRYCRHPLETPVMIATPSGRELHARTVNLSQGGLGVQFVPPPPPAAKTLVRARLVLPPAGTLTEVRGTIVWSNPEGRAGLQCQGVSPRDRQILDKWLEKHTESRPARQQTPPGVSLRH